MILNMLIGSNTTVISAEYTSVSASSSSTLTVNNLQLPGGTVNGFALISSGYVTPTNFEIIYAYATPTQAVQNIFQYGYYYESTGQIEPYIASGTIGFTYDASTGTLTLTVNPSYKFNGAYDLFIW